MTWLPYPNMRLSAHVLDSSTLGVQLGHAITVLRIIANPTGRHHLQFHTTTAAWWHWPEAVAFYADCVHREIVHRGYTGVAPSPRSPEGVRAYNIPKEWAVGSPDVPDWIGMEHIHASHRASLLRKDVGWYSQFGWDEVPGHRPALPRRMPRVGDPIVGPNRQVGIVCEFDSRDRPVVLVDGKRSTIERLAIYSGEWRRGVVAE
jgi:hypothetical protein